MNLFKSTKATTYISSRGDKVYPIIMDIKTGIVEGDAVFTTGDIDTAYLYTTILEEQSDYNILGSTVICNIQRPDGTTMKVQGDVLGNNLIEFPLGQSGVSQEGIYNFDIAVVFSEKKMVTSPTAQYSVTQSIEVIGEIEEDDRFPVLESLISGINVINEEELVRVSNEEVRQSKEEAREQAESVRVRNEDVRLANNEAIRNEEAVRVTNENERKNAESLRVQEENKRKQQENTRIAQENTRVSQETTRVNAENTRKNQEATRQANEATRVSQETNRSQAESTRNSNETVRQNQENTRKNQETARVTAEGNRVTSENVRVSAEQARVLKEQERQAIEVERQNSESTREQQEATRISQENARKQADILRQQEHEERQQFLDGFEGKLNTVVDDVAGIKDDVVSVRETNKRQDVFLQGLYNENLDGRVTVKEEGSVISLTNSDDGLVDIVGLEGNTLVNYVQDGSKELTLNGDIEAEGTSVTLTEGVDNGKVDVVCEGNTLVNLLNKNLKFGLTSTSYLTCDENGVYNGILEGGNYFTKNIDNTGWAELQPNTTYTLKGFLETTCNTTNGKVVFFTQDTSNVTKTLTEFRVNELNQRIELNLTFTTPSDCKGSFGFYVSPVANFDNVKFSFILEYGDTTSYEIPEYFEGMKSVGECEDNKLEIVSHNGNFVDTENTTQSFPYTSNGVTFNKDNSVYTIHGSTDGYPYVRAIEVGRLEPNTTYKFTCKSEGVGASSLRLISRKDNDNLLIFQQGVTFTTPSDIRDDWGIDIATSPSETHDRTYSEIMITKVDNIMSYKPHSLNKKEITLSEPLRALPNGVKDKVVKVGGKWYVERNCGEIKGTDGWYKNVVMSGTGGSRFKIELNKCKKEQFTPVLCNLVPFQKRWSFSQEGTYISSDEIVEHNTLCIRFTEDIELSDFQSKYSDLVVIYQLSTPIYEEITDPTVNTYNDTTHISNNSTIPCNMQIKNTGYNAIIKPSTQYTVAFDTNKTGEVGINLGGSKVTTTNNVATVTTPSTLVDDSLRLTGKGIKASKVRLLEGNKTNWIPSYFEGMKSSFEDKLQDDGSYNVEILSKNRNLFNLDNVIMNGMAQGTTLDVITPQLIQFTTTISDWSQIFCMVQLKPFTTYTLSADMKLMNGYIFHGRVTNWNADKYIGAFQNTSDVWVNKKVTFTTDKSGLISVRITNERILGVNIAKNIQISEVVSDYVPSNFNKIQFPIIEPLRGVGDIKDRFVFKDGKLMIERNCKERDLVHFNFDTIEKKGNNLKAGYILNDVYIQPNGWSNINIKCDKLASAFMEDRMPCISIYHHSYGNELRVSIPQCLLETLDREGVNKYFANNPHKIIYQLGNPTYEEISPQLSKLILEGYENGTLFFDTNIPPTVEASYTANIPVVSELNKNSNEIGLTQEDLSVTQVAVDFLLMSNIGEEMLSSFNLNTRGRNSMGAYFASRIMKGALKYEDVISKYPQYKEEIDSILETK